MASVRALRLVDVATPPALAKAVSSELLARLNMREIPILLMRQQSGAGGAPWLGFCVPSDCTESGEVVIDARCVERRGLTGCPRQGHTILGHCAFLC